MGQWVPFLGGYRRLGVRLDPQHITGLLLFLTSRFLFLFRPFGPRSRYLSADGESPLTGSLAWFLRVSFYLNG